jgi:hypothetical protein
MFRGEDAPNILFRVLLENMSDGVERSPHLCFACLLFPRYKAGACVRLISLGVVSGGDLKVLTSRS